MFTFLFFQDTLESDKWIDQINFAGNGYFNDGLLHMILDHGANKVKTQLETTKCIQMHEA
ncbi:hypothetical protein DPMN_192259 [Dreissena polymorpha]|uniref:Uncharacterized protein n=1 Tax=Dreissena polymorpha TaxID=45954 RepID=A0A9D3Y129_DREPO|nr:hypothetical protein DPMN_192259 [Dreissena polymorpha]